MMSVVTGNKGAIDSPGSNLKRMTTGSSTEATGIFLKAGQQITIKVIEIFYVFQQKIPQKINTTLNLV